MVVGLMIGEWWGVGVTVGYGVVWVSSSVVGVVTVVVA